jgi:aspartyl protease family protein
MGKAFITVAWLLFLAMLTWGFSRWLAEQNNPNQEVQSTRVNGTPSVVLKRNRQGHYVANGKINGQAVTFLVDTGATDVAVPLNWAKRLNLSAKGRAVSIQTANGVITAYRVTLDRVQLGAISQREVRAVIIPSKSQEVLLGMSFLKRLEWTQKQNRLMIHQPQ